MKRATKIRLAVAVVALIVAAAGGWIARVQIERYAADKLLHDLVLFHDVEGVEWAASAGADVNAKGNAALAPLEYIAGLTPSQYSTGFTPLHYAVMSCDATIAKVLIEAGADVSAKDIGCWTPLYYAARHGDTKTAQILIDAGADVNAQSNHGLSPLHNAAMCGVAGTIHVLIDAGADVNARTCEDITPLHYAASGGRPAAVRTLIEAGATINPQHKDGYSPLDFAHDDEISKLLREHGAKTAAELKAEQAKLKNEKPNAE